MNRQWSLFLSILVAIFVYLILYYGAYITVISSLIFSIACFIIVLNFLYPISNVASDPVSISLYIYILLQLLSILLLLIFIFYVCINDVRKKKSILKCNIS